MRIRAFQNLIAYHCSRRTFARGGGGGEGIAVPQHVDTNKNHPTKMNVAAAACSILLWGSAVLCAYITANFQRLIRLPEESASEPARYHLHRLNLCIRPPPSVATATNNSFNDTAAAIRYRTARIAIVIWPFSKMTTWATTAKSLDPGCRFSIRCYRWTNTTISSPMREFIFVAFAVNITVIIFHYRQVLDHKKYVYTRTTARVT